MKYLCWIALLSYSHFAASADTSFLGAMSFNQETIAPALKVFGLLTVLSLAPSILIMLTSFTRIVVVLSMLRTALGLQQTPPNTVLMSLALFLTFYTMMPVGKVLYSEAYQPFMEQKINFELAIDKAKEPIKQFLLHQTREKDLQLLLELAKEPLPDNIDEIKLLQLIPAFLLSELQTAFQIGFMIFLPFLLIDLIVSGLLMTMGMMMLPPASLSVPIKILVFVLINGWDIVIQSLVETIN
ncbi:flagellar type III secretion system pore protein FliP [Legionella sp. 16cNR16C]|uniref:flagellar type III secretion system pore protein FliP n=1 Tax=Legionella sp. 16cNR16C TaxID=2905656 RepID=UPI001E28BA8E|nr:flagellar type III secretion system pore protein FliP [Legionella sp. 16cNR16C]MCE3044269.1 flagellar type III secretion system pore protein FliP [Legionella sp. 16cNR16C]